MLEFLKTSTGAYNLTFILAILGWLVSGVGIFAGFHLTKVRSMESESKAKKAEIQRIEMADKLQASEAKTADLESRLAPRMLTNDQRRKFVAALVDAPKGPVTLVYSDRQQETIKFVEQMKSLMIEAGFTVPTVPEYTLAFNIQPPAPWFISLIAIPGSEPSYGIPIHHAFKVIGVENGATEGSQFCNPGELKLYIGSK